jgi:hypothetical protein
VVETIIKRKNIIATVGRSNEEYVMYKLLVEKYKLPLNGGNSAFIRDCYLENPFNLEINQFDINEI